MKFRLTNKFRGKCDTIRMICGNLVRVPHKCVCRKNYASVKISLREVFFHVGTDVHVGLALWVS
jgi:hypothetical protein